jgi:nucleotide-binding universal stress UspA family protein
MELGSTIHLLYVNTPSNFKNDKVIRARMQEIIHQYPELNFETAVYSHHEIEKGIMEYCHDIKADWIAMATHNRKHKDKYLIGVTETIAFKSDIPVLTVLLN